MVLLPHLERYRDPNCTHITLRTLKILRNLNRNVRDLNLSRFEGSLKTTLNRGLFLNGIESILVCPFTNSYKLGKDQ